MRSLTRATLHDAVAELTARDDALANIVREHGDPPLWARRPGFATLVRIILEQQVSLAAARTMFRRLHNALDGVTPSSVWAAGPDGLRALGLTGQKAAYCHGLAGAIREGRLDLSAVARADDATGRAMLLALPGLGPWSVDIYFLMALRRPDVWPHGDLALAISVQRVKAMPARPDHRTLTAYATQWAPWRSIAARILWMDYLAQRATR